MTRLYRVINEATNIKEVSSDYSVTDGDNDVVVNTATGNVTITLTSATSRTGESITVKRKQDGGIYTLYVVPQAGELIDGETSITVIPRTSITMVSDGTGWLIK